VSGKAWIPAFAGMTRRVAGMRRRVAGMRRWEGKLLAEELQLES